MMPAMNACAVFERLSETLPELGLDAYFGVFTRYARTFYTGDADHDFHLDLKVEHSRNVFTHALAIAGAEDAFLSDAARRRALLLAALFHDFGRFKQFALYGTFSDPQSVNHALLAVTELKRLRIFEREETRIRHLAMAGIVLHNRFAIPATVKADARAVTTAVRDADKLDIMRVMASYLTVEGPVDPVIALHAIDSPEVTPAVLAAVTNRRLGRYGDLRTTTDFKLLVCGWLYDLNYPSSRRMAVKGGHLAAILASLPDTDALRPFAAMFRHDLAAHASA